MAEAELPRHYRAAGEEPWGGATASASSPARVNTFTPSAYTTAHYVRLYKIWCPWSDTLVLGRESYSIREHQFTDIHIQEMLRS